MDYIKGKGKMLYSILLLSVSWLRQDTVVMLNQYLITFGWWVCHCPTAYHWETEEWLPDTCLPGLGLETQDLSPTPPPPPLPAPPPPLILTPSRLGGSVRLGASARPLQTGYPLRRYEGQRDFYSSLSRDECSSPVYEEYRDDEGHYDRLPVARPPYRGHTESEAGPSCYHSGHSQLPSYPPLLAWEERPRVWEDSHPFGSHKEINRLSDRHSLRARRQRADQNSPFRSLSAMGQYEHY